MVSGTDGRMIERLATSFASLRELTWTRLSSISARTRWSLADQALISGVNVLTGILLVRMLGLREFGLFSLAYVSMLFLGGFQVSITGPMMSLFDQRGPIRQSSYLAAVLLHQAVLSIVLATVVVVAPTLFPEIASVAPVNFRLVAAVLVATQFQDLVRRFFYVSERPARAFLCDLIAYGLRLVVVAWFAVEGVLTLDGVWIVMLATSLAALLMLWSDLAAWHAVWSEIIEVTRRHLAMAGWFVGNALSWWFTESGFILLVVGAVLGPAQLGAARAVQNLVSLANPLVIALENFAPSAATKSLAGGGAAAMLSYVRRVSLVGAVAILLLTVTLTVFVDPILYAVYGQTFADAAAIAAILGACVALGHVTSVIYAGLRALKRLGATFFLQAVVGALCIATAWPVAVQWGVLGSLGELLIARVVVAGLFALLLRAYARANDGGERV